VRFVTRRLGFGRDAQVPDFLRDPEEDGLDPFRTGLLSRDQLPDGRAHFPGGLFQVRSREVPVPSRHGLPVRDRAHQKALSLGIQRRHFRFFKGPGYVPGDPLIDDGIFVVGLAVLHRAGYLVLQRDTPERLAFRGNDRDPVVHDGVDAFEGAEIAEFSCHTGLHELVMGDEVNRIPDAETRDAHLEEAVVGIVDIRGHLGGIHHLPAVLLHIDRPDASIFRDDLHQGKSSGVVRDGEGRRDGAVASPPLLREHLHVLLEPFHIGAVLGIFRPGLLCDDDDVGIGILGRGHGF